MAYRLRVNTARHRVDVDDDTPLLWVLRDELGLTGTKFGCGVAQCGACTVYVDGVATRSCVLPISAVGDREVTTIEGLKGEEAAAVRVEWYEHQVPQCGYCQSGQVMSAVALLRQNRRPEPAEVEAAMAGNICRCATYDRIKRAVAAAADRLEV